MDSTGLKGHHILMMPIHAVCLHLHHSMPRCIKSFLCCHGNLLPFTFTIVTCIFALVRLNAEDRTAFTMRHLRHGSKSWWTGLFSSSSSYCAATVFVTSYFIEKCPFCPCLLCCLPMRSQILYVEHFFKIGRIKLFCVY